MYSIVRGERAPQQIAREFPAAAVSVVVSELFYKFHSFSLECLAFLATWFVFSWAAHHVFPMTRPAPR